MRQLFHHFAVLGVCDSPSARHIYERQFIGIATTGVENQIVQEYVLRIRVELGAKHAAWHCSGKISRSTREGWSVVPTSPLSTALLGARERRARPGRKPFGPANSPGCLHHDKQRNDRDSCDRKAGETSPEEGIGEQDEIDQLRRSGL